MKAEVFSAAGSPVRVAILESLRDGELCVCDIARCVGAGRPNVSRHLGILAGAGLVEARKDGLKMFYSIKTPCVLTFLNCVSGVLRHQARQASALLRSMK